MAGNPLSYLPILSPLKSLVAFSVANVRIEAEGAKEDESGPDYSKVDISMCLQWRINMYVINSSTLTILQINSSIGTIVAVISASALLCKDHVYIIITIIISCILDIPGHSYIGYQVFFRFSLLLVKSYIPMLY